MWARTRRNLNQSQLARQMGTSPQAVQQWEKGGGCRQLETLAKRLRVPPAWLAFGGVHEATEPAPQPCAPSQRALVDPLLDRMDALELALDVLEMTVTQAPLAG